MQAGQPQLSSQLQSATGHGQSDSHTSHVVASGEKRSSISSWKHKPTIATAPKMSSMIGLFFMIMYLIKNYVVKSCITFPPNGSDNYQFFNWCSMF